jgi:predicted RNA-binding Zn-ribbon protein involved in translation (DUF1610 family)
MEVAMKKIVIKCKNCKKKMKVLDKAAKYKCPYCKKITNFRKIDRVFHKFAVIVKDGVSTFIEIYRIIIEKTKNLLRNMKK